jgi:DNA polymerase-3 subunit epsilon/ATP-dependent DNA helicase DinG
LFDIGKDLPVQIIAEIVRAGEQIGWDGNWFFHQLLTEVSKSPIKARETALTDFGILFEKPSEILSPPLKANEEIIPLDIDEITAYLSPGGAFSKYFGSQFENRNEQLEMLQAVAASLSESQHLMVEAGTGIGKSFAYLVPAAVWSMKNNARVVVSTNTLNLQDQLINKDIPDLKGAMGIDLRASVLKGRFNYLCPRRFKALRSRKPKSANELRLMAKVLVWLNQGGSGELAEINLSGSTDRDNWSRLSAQDEICSAEVCLNRMGGVCPYFKARQQAQQSHILIVNHALLLSDVVANNRVLPEYKYLIIDEGHHLEDASTNALSYRLTKADVERLYLELGSSASGLLGRVTDYLRKKLKPDEFSSLSVEIDKLSDLVYRSQNEFTKFFGHIEDFMRQERDGKEIGMYGHKVRIIPATQTQPIWDDVSISWDNTAKPIATFLQIADNLLRDIADYDQFETEEKEDLLGDISSILRRMKEIHEHINQMVFELDANTIVWVAIDPKYNSLSLNFAPLHIGPLMENYLWHTKESVIVTSATMTANNTFDYIRARLNADEADELVLGSPFDYENSAMLFLPTDMPEPKDYKNYQRFVERAVLKTAQATGGQMLALFTSYKQLLETSRVISPLLAKDDIIVFEQGTGASTSSLLESFRKAERAVLLGTRSFWEGVDIPGKDLSVLMIIKLPFDVPTDPIIASRAETFENPFSEYTLPEAILRFCQGFGRLIRTQSDRGVVAVLDRRVRSKQYGQYFLQSIPQCHMVESTIEDLPVEAARWLDI